jgi:exodeoxyribonuclease VII large subunit
VAAPTDRIDRHRETLSRSRLRMSAAMRGRTANLRGRLSALAAGLDGVSPLQTLQRGYAVVSDAATGEVVRDARELRQGQRVTARLARGHFSATVDSAEDDD